MEADFSGWATKAGLKCTDGRTIMPGAFAHDAQEMEVPLIWAHDHSNPENVLGKAVLSHKDDGVWVEGYFNETAKGIAARKMLQHGDIKWLSIWANGLVERSKQVFHGAIREVSLVLAGANPGAKIVNVRLAHADEPQDQPIEFDDDVIIHTGIEVNVLSHAEDDEDGETVEDVYNTLSDKQKDVVNIIVAAAVDEAKQEASVAHSGVDEPDSEDTQDDEAETDSESDDADESDENSSDSDTDGDSADENGSGNTAEAETDAGTDGTDTDEGNLSHQEGQNMTRNVFDQNGAGTGTLTLEHGALNPERMKTLIGNAKRMGSYKEAVLAHAQEYGITDIDLLFPEARALTETPEFISRRMEWVNEVLTGVKRTPFAKVKSLLADITADEARAKGYVTGKRKVEEVFGLMKRVTGPTTIYKKQKLDRDDMLDITDINVVAWLKAEMRLMIEEELARCILVGDGRSNASDDKVKDPAGALDGNGIRSILHDDSLYAIPVELEANVVPKEAVKGLVRARTKYRGSGSPTLFVSDTYLTDIMLEEDRFGRPLYANVTDLASKLRVSKIVPVEIFDEHPDLFAIMVNLADYNVGTNAGGQLTSFEDFDIDFNQHKYLQETRLSGALVKAFSAVVVRRSVGTLATATAPSFNGDTNTITIPNVTGVSYYDGDSGEEMDAGDTVITSETVVEARADSGYYLGSGSTRTWTYAP